MFDNNISPNIGVNPDAYIEAMLFFVMELLFANINLIDLKNKVENACGNARGHKGIPDMISFTAYNLLSPIEVWSLGLYRLDCATGNYGAELQHMQSYAQMRTKRAELAAKVAACCELPPVPPAVQPPVLPPAPPPAVPPAQQPSFEPCGFCPLWGPECPCLDNHSSFSSEYDNSSFQLDI